jgi:signal recognition particle subunit SRP54
MFDSLSTRLQNVFQSLRGQGRLTEDLVEAALREIRLALLEADVNFKVVKAFIDRVRDRAMGQEVLRSLSPSQQVVKIVRDEMVALFGDAEGGLQATTQRPRVILLLGLQGAGKTTTAGKLGKWLAKQGRHPLLVSTDVKRPAAIEQLNIVGRQAGLRVHDPAGQMDPVARARGAVAEARNLGFDAVIVDTAGRLHIDDELMTELVAIKDVTDPSDRLFVADAMTGQDAIKSAGEFNARVGVTGVVLTKMDGDARGGAALSVVSVVGVPIAFVGSGARISSRSTPIAWCRGCSGWATCCRSSRRPRPRSTRKTRRGSKRGSVPTSSRWRISAISSRPSRKWDRSSRSWGCCRAWATSRRWRRTSQMKARWSASKRSSTR